METSSFWAWLLRLAGIITTVASLLFLLGFATDHWYDDDTVNFGLWETCHCTTLYPDDVERYHGAARAFQILSMLFYLFATGAAYVTYVILSESTPERPRSYIYHISLGLGLICHFISVIIFGVSESETSWSFNMSVTSFTFATIGLVLLIAYEKLRLGREGTVQPRADHNSSADQNIAVVPTTSNDGGQAAPRADNSAGFQGNHSYSSPQGMANVRSPNVSTITAPMSDSGGGGGRLPLQPTAPYQECLPPPTYEEAVSTFPARHT